MANRPSFHFTPKSGWLNDPNGTILINDTYHLFYQHYPNGLEWGPMHWGHAISNDLLHWTHLDIALYPDELGYIFSGSAVLDIDNLSGLGSKERPALLTFFTHHNPETGEQQQSIAYSHDYINFHKYNNNPVIANHIGDSNYKVDFRDPKVFKNPNKSGYSMVLAAGNILEFYYSDNLLNWNKTGEFDPSINGYGGICECPDCFEIKTANGSKWILTLSSIIDDKKVGLSPDEKGYCNQRVMQYFIGEFDGNEFLDTALNPSPMILDYGPDNYAFITFNGCEEPIGIGWACHWDYVNSMPATKYRGQMTMARRLGIINTEYGQRLTISPYFNYLSNDIPNVEHYSIKRNETLSIDDVLTIYVTNDILKITRNPSSFPISIDINKYHTMTAKRLMSNRDICNISIIKDNGFYEIFADDNTLVFSIAT